MIMTIHTFGENMGYNCHLHALVADGLFADNGMFYVAPKVSTKPLEQLFRHLSTQDPRRGSIREEAARANMLLAGGAVHGLNYL